jgi:bifunctional DNA-binding transcriptional regulator/antitoxin component of YhaV-PrlF toxin-antitoxin module
LGVIGMTTLTVTAKGQVTLRKELLHHLGVRPGQKLEVTALPGSRVEVSAARAPGTIDDFIGLLAEKSRKVATLEEIDEAAADGWAGRE